MSPVRENRLPGSVRGAPDNRYPCLDISNYARPSSSHRPNAFQRIRWLGLCVSACAVIAGAFQAAATPLIAVSTNQLNFTQQAVGKATPLSLTVTNLGSTPLTLTGMRITNSVFFFVAPNFPAPLSPGAVLGITVGFTPAVAGPVNGTLTIVSDDPANPSLTVSLTGQGVVPVECFPVPPGALAWWPGEDNVTDELKGHPGVASHGVSYADGMAGRAFKLDGQTNYLEIADSGDWNLSTNDFAIELWANFGGPVAEAGFVAHDDGKVGWSFGVRGGAVSLHLDSPAGPLDIAPAPFAPQPGNWHHMAVTRGGSAINLYVDGAPSGQATFAAEVPAASTPLTLGQAGGGFFFKGLLDEVTIYHRQLSADEVKSIFQAGSAGKCYANGDPVAPPALRIAQSPAGLGILWRSNDFRLEATDALDPSHPWQAVTNPPASNGADLVVALSPAGVGRFYRLHGTNAASAGLVPSGYPALPGVFQVSRTIAAAQGGDLTTSDGLVTLSIPPGALAADQQIAVTNFAFNASGGGQEVHEIVLAPAGLKLLKPAQLTVTFSQPGALTNVMVYWLSAENPPLDLGSEISQWHQVESPTANAAAGTATVPVDHFSVGSFVSGALNGFAQGVGGAINYKVFTEPAYMVFELDGKYLKKGDLLYVLSKAEVGAGHTWIPGHTGLYLGAVSPTDDSNDGETVIESTPADAPLGQTDGVQLGRLEKFKTLGGNHVYMGARRPLFKISDADRTTIAGWAISKQGVPYSKIGGPFIATGSPFGGLSCVGLTEGAYEAAGKRIVPGLIDFLLWPVRQFDYTAPVDEVTLSVGDKFNMYVDGVIRSGLNYNTDSGLYQISVTADDGSPADTALKAGRAQLITGGFTRFQFNPTNDDSELTPVFKFTLSPTDHAYNPITRRFFVHVRSLELTVLRQAPRLFTDFIQGVYNPGNILGIQTAATGSVVVTNLQAIMTLNWPAPPPSLTASGTFDFPMTAGFTATGVQYAENWFISATPIALYLDDTGKVLATVNGNTAFTGYDVHQKPGTVSTNSTFAVSLTTISGFPGKNFTLSSLKIHVFRGHNGIYEYPLYDVFWDYKPAP